MKQKINKPLLIIFESIIAAALMLQCDSVWTCFASTRSHFTSIMLGCIVLGVAGCAFVTGAVYKIKKLLTAMAITCALLFLMLCYLFLTDCSNHQFVKIMILTAVLLFYVLLCCEPGKLSDVFIRYSQIVTVVAALSIICWLVFSVFKLMPATGSEMTCWNGKPYDTPVNSYLGIYFDPQTIKLFGENIIRNSAIFTEAPLSSLHFSFALLISLFIMKKTNWIRNIILILAVITTFSTTGICVTLLALAAKLVIHVFTSEKFRALSRKMRILIPALTGLLVIAAAAVCAYLLIDRLDTGSGSIRLEDFRAAFEAWFDRPLLGNGFLNNDAIKQHFAGERASYAGFSCSNAFARVLADGGLFFGALMHGSYIACLIRALRRHEWELAVCATAMFAVFAVTIVPYEYLIIFIFISFACYQGPLRRRIYGLSFDKNS